MISSLHRHNSSHFRFVDILDIAMYFLTQPITRLSKDVIATFIGGYALDITIN